MILVLAKLALAGVLINEVVYDPTGSDGTQEWIELCVDDGASYDLSGWSIEAGGASFGVVYSFAAGSVGPGEYVVVGGGVGDFADALEDALQNGGSESDGLRLVDADGNVVDTLLYDSPNDNLLPGDGEDSSVTPAADVSEGHSLGRWPDCSDSNVPGTDFADYASPSQGVANVDPGGEDTGDTGDSGDSGDTGDSGTSSSADCSGSASVVINEFYVESGAEWIELHNAGGGVALEGWELAFGSSSYKDPVALDAVSLAGGDWFLIGTGGGDQTASLDLGNSSGAIQLRCGGAVVDTVVYGEDASDWVEDPATDGAAYAPGPESGQSLARWTDGYDTDVCADDFHVSSGTPDASNGDYCPPTCDVTGAEGLKINEFLSDASSTDDGYEWIELFNAGSTTISLDDFVVEVGTQEFGEAYSFGGCTDLAPGDFVVIGGSGVPEADYVADFSLGNGSSSCDGIQVLDCEGRVLDRVFYGEGSPETSFFADGEPVETECVPAADAGYSNGRATDGVDSDSVDDWAAFSTVSPGESNGSSSTGGTDCSGSDGVTINELYVETDAEWVELYNGGGSAVSLGGWQIRYGSSSYKSPISLEAASLGPGEWLLVGTAEGDLLVDLDFGNSNGAVQLLCDGAPVDSVAYGADVSGWIEDDSTDGAAYAPAPEDGYSLARWTDGGDSDVCADDFHVATPSPGATNGDGGEKDTGGDEGGCGGDRPDGERGCVVVAAPLGGLELLAGLAVLRRRRR